MMPCSWLDQVLPVKRQTISLVTSVRAIIIATSLLLQLDRPGSRLQQLAQSIHSTTVTVSQQLHQHRHEQSMDLSQNMRVHSLIVQARVGGTAERPP